MITPGETIEVVMVRNIALALSLLIFALGILSASVLRTVSPGFVFSQSPRKEQAGPLPSAKPEIDYYLVYPGILPDHFLWPAKALRDRIWLFLTTDHKKKSELYLLLSDKRIGAARVLLDGGKTGSAVETSLKAEQYLEKAIEEEVKAREGGINTAELLEKQLALSALKHREILEDMYGKAPDDARVEIAKILEKHTKPAYENIKMSLIRLNRPLPVSPF